MLIGSISPVRQYWKYLFFLCPTMEADMEALGVSCSSNCNTQSCACFVLLWRLGLVGLDSTLRFVFPLNFHGLPRVAFAGNCRTLPCACLVLLWRLGLVGLALCKKHTASLREIHGVFITRILHLYDSPKSLQNCIVSLKLKPFGCGKTSGDVLKSFWAN